MSIETTSKQAEHFESALKQISCRKLSTTIFSIIQFHPPSPSTAFCSEKIFNPLSPRLYSYNLFALLFFALLANQRVHSSRGWNCLLCLLIKISLVDMAATSSVWISAFDRASTSKQHEASLNNIVKSAASRRLVSVFDPHCSRPPHFHHFHPFLLIPNAIPTRQQFSWFDRRLLSRWEKSISVSQMLIKRR